MDEQRIEALGAKPLQPLFAKVTAVQDKKELGALIGTLGQIAPNQQIVDAPFGILIHQDNKDSTKYVADLQQEAASACPIATTTCSTIRR